MDTPTYYGTLLGLLLLMVLPPRIAGQTTSSPLTTDAPMSSLSCDFETGDICGFDQSDNDDFDWTRNSGATPTANTGPAVDHTTGTSVGFYMFTESSSQPQGDTCVLSSPTLSKGTQVRCLEFYYHMYGIDLGVLRVYAENTENQTVEAVQLLQESGNKGEQWQRALINLEASTNNYRLNFVVILGSHHQGDISIDDVSVQDGYCPLEQLSCDFEDPSVCRYTHDSADDVQVRLIRRAGSTPSSFTGPSVDHTIGDETGYYMYMESSGLKEGNKARLVSPVIAGSSDGSNCLILWYHMYGEAIDTLLVYAKNVSDTGLGDPLWSLSGNKGNIWRATEMDLSSPKDFQIFIETRGSGDYRGDIAIDDVMITGEVCPGEYVYTNTSGVTCDFESADICYYTQDQTDDADWTWQNSATRDRYTGPDNDHTRGDSLGFYLVYSGNGGKPGELAARLITPPVPPTSATSCVEFWYHMWGDDIEALNVYVVPATYTSLPDTPSWSTTGNQGNYWHRATVTFPRKPTQTKLVFEARNGRKERDDIALDDVTLYASKACPAFITIAPSTTTRPDPVRDISCTFEQDFCGYIQATDDLFDWNRHQGPTSSHGSGPDVDHTLGTAEGYYALMDCSNNYLRFDDRTRLLSPLLAASTSPRCLTFYYYKYSTNSRNQDFLNVYITEWGHRLGFDPNWNVFGVTKAEWVEGRLTIPSSDNPVQVVFEGSIAFFEYLCDIAVDDISLGSGSCPVDPDVPTYVENINCSFEDGEDLLCGYTQEDLILYNLEDTVDWVIGSGPTGTAETGPDSDHTYGTSEGHYLYIESSQPQRPGDNAVIVSPRLLASFDYMCLEFYYHMKGEDTAWLRVHITVDNEDTVELAGVSGQKEADWRPMLVDIPPFRGGLRISFEGKVGEGYRGDIAIDDIRTFREPCGGYPQDTECEFEFGFDDCMYDFVSTNNMAQWTWFDEYSGNPPVTLVTGSFMYTSSVSGQTAARITSNGFRLNQPHCIIFTYSIRGATASLQATLELSNGSKLELVTLTEETVDGWSFFWTDLGGILTDGYAKIRFIGTTSVGSVIAVDNVGALSGICDFYADRYGMGTIRKPVSDGSNAGMIIGIILGVVALLVLVALGVLYLRSHGVKSDINFRFNNGNDPTLTASNTLSADPGIANPNYDQTNLTTA